MSVGGIMKIYLFFVMITFLTGGIVWSKNGYLNLLIKTYLVLMAIASIVLWLKEIGVVSLTNVKLF